MPIRDSMEFETRGFQHHKGTVGLFKNKWVSLAIGLVLIAIVLTFLIWCRAEFVAQYGDLPHLRPTSTHFQ